jgi:hypothetical protein
MIVNCYGAYHLKLSLVEANVGTLTLETFEKHPQFGGQIAPSARMMAFTVEENFH